MARNLQLYSRTIHRILGYLAIGMVVVYALSGIILIHRTGNLMKKTVEVEATLKPNLNADELAAELKIKHFKVDSESDEVIKFKQGYYNKVTGHVSYTNQEIVKPFDKFVELHVVSDGKNRHVAAVATVFGVVLLLLAITSLFMYKPSAKPFKANMLYTICGVVITILLILLL